jgi:crotonobetainyl-CoA:carnitine CoA-transferase CaiB-like acyl-CoA transferase
MSGKPLEGIRVCDLTRFVSGPFCTQILADMGADVIKIEKGTGDNTRHFAPWIGEKSIYFDMMNRNKRSVKIDYRKSEGKELLLEIVKKCDVIVENFRPGTLEKMGLGKETLDEINPGIIVTHVSGFGQTGPYKDRAAFDCIAQAMSGIMSLTGDKGTKPMMIGSVYLDYMGGTFGALATVIALLERQKSGLGQEADIAMLDAGVAYSLFSTEDYIANGVIMDQDGNRDRALSPANTFMAKDGKYVYIHAGTDPFFEIFAKKIGREDLLAEDKYKYSPQRMANPEYMEDVTGEWVAQHNAYEIEEELNALGLPCAVVANTEDLVNNPQVKARDMLKILEYPDGTKMPVVNTPIKLSRTPGGIDRLAPEVGENTDEILRELLQKSDQEIEKLKKMAVI